VTWDFVFFWLINPARGAAVVGACADWLARRTP
jgi:hypothetical protein